MELTPFHSIALRTGFYKDKLTKIDILTGGIGLLNSASIRSTEGQFIFPEFVLNYGFQVEKAPSALNFNHVLTLLLRL
jgi:hypothetical protein